MTKTSNADITAEFDLEIDVILADPQWEKFETDFEKLVNTAIGQAMASIKVTPIAPAEICVLLSNDVEQQKLNAKWRNADKTTNVLSFPQIAAFAPVQGMLGDITLALQTVQSEAKQQNKQFNHHFTHLVVHGFLHILGFDHQTDTSANQMETAEIDILAQLGINNPYLD